MSAAIPNMVAAMIKKTKNRPMHQKNIKTAIRPAFVWRICDVELQELDTLLPVFFLSERKEGRVSPLPSSGDW